MALKDARASKKRTQEIQYAHSICAFELKPFVIHVQQCTIKAKTTKCFTILQVSPPM